MLSSMVLLLQMEHTRSEFATFEKNNGPDAERQGSKSPAFLESVTLTTLNYKLLRREGDGREEGGKSMMLRVSMLQRGKGNSAADGVLSVTAAGGKPGGELWAR